MSLKDKSQSHLLFVDSLRALAAIYVLMHHAVLQYFQPDNTLRGFGWLMVQLFMYGHYAVDLFIVLSGFSLMLSVARNNYNLKGGTLLFLKRRAVRILPPYYLAILFSLVLIRLFVGQKTGTHWDSSIPVTAPDVIRHFFLIHDFFSSSVSRINHSLWSVSVEFRIYLFFPLLVWLWKKYNWMVPVMVSMFIAIAGLGFIMVLFKYNNDIKLDIAGVCPYIISFSAGMLAADLSFSNHNSMIVFRTKYKSFSRIKLFIYILFYLLTFELVRQIFKMPIFSEKNIHRNLILDINDIFAGFLFAYIMFICSTAARLEKKPSILLRSLNWKPLFFIGTFSYSIYLIHAPLLQVLTQYLIAPLHLSSFTSCWLLTFFSLPVIIFIAYIFFLVCERPFLTLGKKQNEMAIEIIALKNPAP